MCGVFSIFVFNYALLKYYTDPHETVKVTLIVQVLAFSSVMIYILLIPFDVFATVRHFETVFGFVDPIFGTRRELTIYDLYFLCYVGMIYMCFIGLPFSYFYAESVQKEEEQKMDDSYEGLQFGLKGHDSSESSEEEVPDDSLQLDSHDIELD